MSDNALTLGVIGGALSSAVGYAHVAALRMDARWRLDAGVFSTDAANNQATGECYGVDPARRYTSLAALLAAEAERLDAVALLTPTPLHAEMANSCMRVGLPVICEKALAMTRAEADALKNLCRERQGFLAVVYNYSGYPMVRELRRLIRDGALGDLLHIQAEMPQEGYLRSDAQGRKPQPQAWRLSDGPVPTLYLDLAVHLHELIFYLTGLRPLEAIADQASRSGLGVIDQVTCLTRYERQMQGQFWFSKCALGHRNGLRLRLYGTEAAAEWYQLAPEELLLSYRDGRRELLDRAGDVRVAYKPRYARFKAGHPAGFIEALANIYVDIHDALMGYRSTGRLTSDEVFGAELAAEGLAWMEAMVRSCKSGRWEQV